MVAVSGRMPGRQSWHSILYTVHGHSHGRSSPLLCACNAVALLELFGQEHSMGSKMRQLPVVLHDPLPQLLGLSQQSRWEGVDDVFFRGQQHFFPHVRREGGKNGGQVHF